MTEQNKAPDGGAPPDTGAGASAAATQPNAEKEPSNADRAARRITRDRDKAIAEAERLRAQLADIEASKKTDHEKAIEEARKAAAKEVEQRLYSEMLTKDIRTEIRLKLAAAGVPENQVAVVLDESKPETLEEATQAAADYATRWANEIARPARPAGQAGAPSAKVGPTALTLKEVQKMSREEYTARYGEIQEGIASGRIQ